MKVLRVAAVAAVTGGVLMFGTVGSASAACSADSSSGPDPAARTGTPIVVPLVGNGWIGVAATGVNGAAERAGTGYIEGVVQLSGTNVAAAGEAANTNPLVGYFDGSAAVSGTSVSASGDGSTAGGAVTGSADVGTAGANDVELVGVCLTP
jgi:hypothetical protein